MSCHVMRKNGFVSVVLLAAVLGGIAGCASSGRYIAYADEQPVEAVGAVVTFVDFFDAGRVAVQDYFDGLPPKERAELTANLERACAACVRLMLTSEIWSAARAFATLASCSPRARRARTWPFFTRSP